MIKLSILSFVIILSFTTQNLFSQYKMMFGNITTEQLSNKPYLSDPGADAVILSDIGVATLNYSSGFYLELERDVRIRIINSNGFDYADIEIPFSVSDKLLGYRASSFNIRNGEKIETVIPKKSFILEESSKYRKSLKFNFPDVHEGTIIEYSYVVVLKDESIFSLVPWIFQSSIPIEYTSLTVAYPEYFIYKTIISGNPLLVNSKITSREQNLAGERGKVQIYTWSAQNVKAFNTEPYIKSVEDNETRLSFELASVNFPNSSFEEISPTYATLTKKLLLRDDFGLAIKKAAFLKETAENLTKDLKDDLSKVKIIHNYVSTKIFWNGDADFTSSASLKKVYNNEKGNSADINMILIAMLRSINIKADPVILCTRSNGTLNKYSAMLQQFNYTVANVTVGDESYLIDATNPLRPFNILPFECLNGFGRLINEFDSRFVDLKNSEKRSSELKLTMKLSSSGVAEGDFNRRNIGYTALNIREQVKLEGEEGYEEIMKDEYSEVAISDFKLRNIAIRDSDIIETCTIKIEEGAIKTGDKLILDPYFSFETHKNPFPTAERNFPVDFGCPIVDNFSMSLQIPDQYTIEEIPDNVSYSIGNNDAKYAFTCSTEGNMLLVNSSLQINKTTFSPAEYSQLRDFTTKTLQSQARYIVFKKKI